MRDRIKAKADENGRSMNAEIVHALESWFPADPTPEQLLFQIRDIMEYGKMSGKMSDGDTLNAIMGTLDELRSALARESGLTPEEEDPIFAWLDAQPDPRPTPLDAIRLLRTGALPKT